LHVLQTLTWTFGFDLLMLQLMNSTQVFLPLSLIPNMNGAIDQAPNGRAESFLADWTCEKMMPDIETNRGRFPVAPV